VQSSSVASHCTMHRHVVLSVGVLTLIFVTMSTTFTLIFAVVLSMSRSHLFGLALTTAVLNVLSLVWVAILFTQISRKESTRIGRTSGFMMPTILISCTTAVMTLTTLLCMQVQPSITTDTTFGSTIFDLLCVEYALWAIQLVIQAIFFLLCFKARRNPAFTSVIPQDMPPRLPEIQEHKSTISLPYITFPWYPDSSKSSPSSPSTSTFSSEAKISSRTSQQTPVSPISFRTRLTEHFHSPRLSKSAFSEHVSQANIGDPSAKPKEEQATIIVLRPTSSINRRVEPISGSRPNSPATALDGPILTNILHVDHSPTPHRRESSSAFLDTSALLASEGGHNQESRREVPAEILDSRQGGLPPDESNVHPLFRTDNPLPPPTATHGTIITASAFSGQYVSARTLSRCKLKNLIGKRHISLGQSPLRRIT